MALLERFPALHRSIGFGASLYLEGMSQFQRNIVISAFAQAVREYTFSKRNKEHLAEGTVNATISYVSQAFWANARNDPRLDADGKPCFLLQEQWRGYKNKDKDRKKQKALPASVLRKMHQVASTPWQTACVQLLILVALFFCMRS